MKNEKYEFVQRIESHYVGDDCIQIMIPHFLNSGITILNSDGMTYHYKPNSYLFVNKYTSDKRKEQFPYSQIPNHKSRVRFKKLEYVNQILDFNRVYIEISNGIIKEDYVVKDGDEALIATKYIIPNQEQSKYVTREEMLEVLKTANGGMFSGDGGHWENYSIPTEERILEWYKEQLINKRKNEQQYYNGDGTDDNLTKYFYQTLDKLTIHDVPSDLTVFEDAILINVDNGEIKSVKAIVVKFISADHYKIETYDFPITIYSLEHMKKLEQTNSRKTLEPKFPRLLNKAINKEEIKKAKQLVLERKKTNK